MSRVGKSKVVDFNLFTVFISDDNAVGTQAEQAESGIVTGLIFLRVKCALCARVAPDADFGY